MSDDAIETTRDTDRPANEEGGAAAVIETPDGETVQMEELTALREKAAEADTLRDQYLRALADFENFRKRAARERQEAVEFANQGLFEKLIPVIDNLEMAMAAVNAAQGDQVESLKTGVGMVFNQLSTVLREAGLQEIDAQGQAFDPTWHEAMGQQETTEVPDGHVVQQIRKGYRLHQRLLRPASVVVARAPQV